MRRALERPNVRRYLTLQRNVLLASIVAKNPHRLAELRDQDSNPAASVRAAVALEQMIGDERARAAGHQTLPGLQIVIEVAKPASPTDRAQEAIDVTPPARPMIEHDHEPPPTEHGEFISIEEVRGEQTPQRDDPPPLVEEPPPHEPKTLSEWQEHILRQVQPLAPPTSSGQMVGCKKQPWEDGYEAEQRSQRRQSPRARRLRSIRED
jgi:hypothetical protein